MACAPLRTARSSTRKLFFDAAVELAVVLVAAAGGQEDAVRVLFEELRNGLRALAGTAQVVQAKFKEDLAGLGFAPGVLEQVLERLAGPTRCRCGGAIWSAPLDRKEFQDNTGAARFRCRFRQW